MNISRYCIPMTLAALLALGACSSRRTTEGAEVRKSIPATTEGGASQAAPGGGSVASGGSTAPAETAAAATDAVHVSHVERVEGALSTTKGPAPNFVWKDAAGKERSLNDYRGKVVLINFWGTWCPPCRAELPDIVKLRDELGPKGFEVIGLNVGEEMRSSGSPEDHVAAFATKNNIRYPLVLAGEDLVNAYGGLEGVPTTFIVNGKGVIVEKMVGMQDAATFRRAIEGAM